MDKTDYIERIISDCIAVAETVDDWELDDTTQESISLRNHIRAASIDLWGVDDATEGFHLVAAISSAITNLRAAFEKLSGSDAKTVAAYLATLRLLLARAKNADRIS